MPQWVTTVGFQDDNSLPSGRECGKEEHTCSLPSCSKAPALWDGEEQAEAPALLPSRLQPRSSGSQQAEGNSCSER